MNRLTDVAANSFAETQPIPTLHGPWYPLDERLFKRRIERLVELACTIDGLKRHLIDPEQRARLMHAVDELHAVAAHYDALGGYGLYGDAGRPT